MADFIVEKDHSKECISAAEEAIGRALEIIGQKAVSYAVQLAAPRGPKGNAFPSDLTSQIRNSISYKVEGDTVIVGSNLDIAAFVELGTSKEYSPSADWIKTTVKKGQNSGLDHWYFYDEDDGKLRLGLPMAPTPFLRPAIEEHKDEYEAVLKGELEKG